MKLRISILPLLIIPVFFSTAKHTPVVREVLTSQQLFVVKLSTLKTKSKKGTQKFEAETRDAFKVIRYERDSSYVELNWTICPEGDCPEMGQFDEGTPGYRKIDTLILKNLSQKIL